MKKIVFLTGTRADFGKLKPLINKIEYSNKFECYIFATGMHTLSKYGASYHELKKIGYQHIFVFMNQTNSCDMDSILSNTLVGFGNFIKEINPDLIVVHGDRLEALAGAIVGSFNNIPVAHVSGGEISGTIDESIRHAVTKFSHIHFVSNERSKKRVMQLGEKEDSIFIIGDPAIDIMLSKNLPTLHKAKSRYSINFDDYSIFIYHPVTTELDKLKSNINEVVSSLLDSKKNYIVIHPNNDAGTKIIVDELDRLKNNKKFKIFPTLRFEYFLTLLKNSEFIIGNSSCGINEAEIYGIPSINIGTRQQSRTMSENVINVEEYKKDILDVINDIENREFKPLNNFGDGNSNKLFYKIISDDNFWNIDIQKKFIERN